MTPAEFYTYQFYTWEFRGRGWLLSDAPVLLEPPFIPFYRHGRRHLQIDDGKRDTFFSKLAQSLKAPKPPIFHEQEALDYETLIPFLYENDSELQALQIKFVRERKTSADTIKAVLTMLSFIFSPISFEIIGTASDIIVQFVTGESHCDTLETYLKAYFPDLSFQRNNQYIEDIIQVNWSTMVVDFGLKEEFVRPLASGKSASLDPLIGIMGVLDSLQSGEQGGIQILFQPVVNQWTDSIKRSVTMYDKTSFFKDSPEFPLIASEKVKSALYGVAIRAFAQGRTNSAAEAILERLSHSLTIGSKSPYNELIPLLTAHYDFTTRMEDILLRESHRLGMLLNQDELLTFLHFPSYMITSPKLLGTQRKTKALPPIAVGKKYVIGVNNHNGTSTKVTVGIEDRLKHMHIIGSTGTGKSTLIANLLLQDIKEKHSLVLFDPHGDLVDDIISHIPKDRLEDVVLIDPADIEYPIGLNILEARDDIEKEVLSSDLVSAFRRFATSWGDQMSGVLGNAILAILESREVGSLHDLRRFLIETDFRTKLLKSVSDPAVLYYWRKEFPVLKTNAVGPILIRLDAFLRPKSVRNMVIQKKGIDFETLLNENKIILLKLSQGLIGKENSYMLGSLILSKLHQVIQRRQQYSTRTPIFIYLDEFQNFITPSIKEMLSGIRKYNAGLILVHQDLQQLQRDDGELLNSVLGNANTRIVFRVGEQDAKKLQEGFSFFDPSDLQNLGKGEAVMRIEQPQYDCSVDTNPLPTIAEENCQQNREAVACTSRKNFAVSKQMVEQELYETFETDQQSPPNSIRKERILPDEGVPAKEIHSAPIKPQTGTRKSRVHEGSKQPVPQEAVSSHRYLQTLVKKMAESKGYTAILEKQLPSSMEKVDVALEKGGKRIAVEICITTDVDWEVHNIEKCLQANYDRVISLSGDIKQLERIKKRCLETLEDIEKNHVFFLTPDALFAYLDEQGEPMHSGEQVIKGYRVNVSYDAQTVGEMERKRALVAQVIGKSLKKKP